jgi:hypothetical protein
MLGWNTTCSRIYNSITNMTLENWILIPLNLIKSYHCLCAIYFALLLNMFWHRRVSFLFFYILNFADGACFEWQSPTWV